MSDIPTNMPLAEVSDAAEVSAALETARKLWSEGHALESVRCIQRAAENAEAAGNDLRALVLARAAADLRAEVSVGSDPPGAMTEGAALTSYDDFTEQTIVDSPASSLARMPLQSGVQIELPATAPTSSSVVAAPAPLMIPTAATAPLTTPELHQVLRVYVLGGEPLTRQLSVRILGAGETAPPGSTEALLVSLDPRYRLI